MSEDKDIDWGKSGVSVAEILLRIGHAKSKSEARRLISGGAVKIGSIKIADPFARFVVLPEKNKFVIVERST